MMMMMIFWHFIVAYEAVLCSYCLWYVSGVHTVSFVDVFTDRQTTSLRLRLLTLPNTQQIQNWALKVISVLCWQI